MPLTRFGEFVRILRIKRREVMGDMAKALGVRVSFLSAVENGKKNPPSDWLDKLSAVYNLAGGERKELEEAIEESKTQYRISTENAGVNQRKAAMVFARSFDDLDDETAVKIMDILRKGKGDD